MNIEQLKYPVGKYNVPQTITQDHINEWIEEVEQFPLIFGDFANQLSDVELNTPYREGGWNGKQVIHHVVDSHMNAYIRTKLALTEDRPTISSYNEALWAEMSDVEEIDISVSLHLLEGLHRRWVSILKAMANDDLKRVYVHPEYGREYPLDEVIGLYAWHGRHHLGHLKLIKSA